MHCIVLVKRACDARPTTSFTGSSGTVSSISTNFSVSCCTKLNQSRSDWRKSASCTSEDVSLSVFRPVRNLGHPQSLMCWQWVCMCRDSCRRDMVMCDVSRKSSCATNRIVRAHGYRSVGAERSIPQIVQVMHEAQAQPGFCCACKAKICERSQTLVVCIPLFG